YSYRLPNGTIFYMDEFGNVSRIQEGGTETAVGEYEFVRDGSGKVIEIRLARGISIDLTSGELTIDEDATYEVIMSAVEAGWWGFDNGRTTIRLSRPIYGSDGSITGTDEWDV